MLGFDSTRRDWNPSFIPALSLRKFGRRASIMSNVPDDPLPLDVQALENDARLHPDSEWRHSRFLLEFCRQDLERHPRRIGLILDFISRFPRSSSAQCPIVHVDPTVDAEAFKSIEALWLRLRSEDIDDPALAIGHAALVANEDRTRAAEILRAVIALTPEDADLWTELGRIAPEPSERFEALQKARTFGSNQPNLLVWIGRAAVDAGRSHDIVRVGSELITRANQTRDTVRAPIAWDDTGPGAWTRIRASLEHASDRPELIDALSEYAHDTHWAHTFLGLVAAEQGRLLEAGKHLLSSSRTWGEPRLSSYGPSFLLARKLCEASMWEDVETFLVGCKNFWEEEILDDWIQEVRNERIPDFDDE
jgi:hypothetical protein